MDTREEACETLEGILERVVYHNPDNGFAVLRLRVRGHRDLVPVVGYLASADEGEYIAAAGQWVIDKHHGQQFKAGSLCITHPATREGIEKFLGSGVIKGIGRHLAGKLVETFKDRVLEVITEEPTRLLEVPGIGVARQKMITKSWHDRRAVREIMIFLQGHGVGTARALRIYKTYGDDAVRMVKHNPYRLAQDIGGIGFKTADELAGRLGVERNSPLRAQAGVAFVLQEMTTKGHCAFPEDGLVERSVALLGIEAPTVRAAVDHEVGTGRLVRDRINDQMCIYLAGLHRAETQLAAGIRRLQQSQHPLPKINIEKALAWVQQQVGLTLAPAQRDAVAMATHEKVLVITGGPGVGKTTIVNSILKIFNVKSLNCILCAPTGRAAKRMTETSGCDARTIHRLLEFDPRNRVFNRHADNPLEADVVLVDEASMMDLPLAHSLISAVPPEAALILVGDVDQLPSVGPGSVLKDLINSGVVSTIRLTEIFRQAAASRIIQAAHQINAGETPDLSCQDKDGDFYFFNAQQPEAAAELIVEIVTQRIPKRFGFDPTSEVQVLSPMHRGVLGVRNLNQILQARLNPPREGAPQIERFGYAYRIGDKVLQTENNYDKDVFNGDLGIIRKVDLNESEISVDFGGRLVVYEFGELDELMLAYAMSIHKSQGSEFPALVIPVHTQHYVMLQRNLLYTGVTRGKRLVVLVGMPKAVEMAAKRADAMERHSALRLRLQKPINKIEPPLPLPGQIE